MKKTITDLLKHLKVPVSSAYCEQLIASHPDYPSLLSIVDTLNRLGIPHTAARIDKEQLSDLVFPYVLQLSTKHGDIITIKNAGDLARNKEKLEFWDGIVLYIEHTDKITDRDNDKAYKRQRFHSTLLYILAATFLVPFGWGLIATASVVTTAIFLLAGAGLILGYLLIAKDLGVRFDVVENFCTPEGKVNDCDMVMESEGASLFGLFKLSDLVFVYFLCQVCCLSFAGFLPAQKPAIIQTLSVLSALVLPMIVYSVIYQLKIGRWCKLCLIVDGILLAQAVLLLAGFSTQFSIPYQPGVLIAIGVGTALVASSFFLFKGHIENILELETIAADAGRTKNSVDVFRNLISGEEVELLYDSSHHLISGKGNAPLKFVMVSNLNCTPCANKHREIEKLVEMYPDLVSFEFRFVNAKDSASPINSNRYIIEYWLRNIKGHEDEGEQIKRMMLTWYESMDPKKFRKQYPMENPVASEECIAIEKAHLDWRTRQAVYRTPTFFLNGRKLPKQYTPNDLATMIPALAATIKKTVSVPISHADLVS